MRKPSRLIKFSLYLVKIVALVLTGALVASALLINAGKKLNANNDWYATPNGIHDEFYLNLGGFKQFVHIRGRNRNNPVLLDLHGGPGSSQSSYTHRIYRPLAEHFTLVEWDQRGAGRSIGNDDLVNSMNYQQMVDDTVELIEHLQKTLKVKKVILVGHSWGAMLSLGVIQKRPDLIAAYVGVGQALAWNKGADETARLLLNAAKAVDDQATITSLESLPQHWPPVSDWQAYFDRLMTIHAPLVKYGKGYHAAFDGDYLKSPYILDALLSPDVEISGLFTLLNKSPATTALIKDLNGRDLREDLGYAYQVPMFMFQGEHDWQTPTTLVKPWFNKITAPHKEYISFEHSAHDISTEEFGKYSYELISRVRPFALSSPAQLTQGP